MSSPGCRLELPFIHMGVQTDGLEAKPFCIYRHVHELEFYVMLNCEAEKLGKGSSNFAFQKINFGI